MCDSYFRIRDSAIIKDLQEDSEETWVAFSISSKRTIAFGLFCSFSVNMPPSSYPYRQTSWYHICSLSESKLV